MTQPQAKPQAKSQAKPLPAQFVIRLGRWVWLTLWHVMMSQMAPRSQSGEYLRPESQFRGAEILPEAGRYRLLVGLGCPWAHRTLIVRAVKGLESAISVAVVRPSPEAGGWVFEQPELGCQTVRQLYELAQPGYTGRCTVPILWDSVENKIVNNESSEIIVILNAAFNTIAEHPEIDLYPELLRPEIDSWNQKVYDAVNNGVYRCGFAQTQSAYEQACKALFATLDEIEVTLQAQRFLCGSQLTLADVRLFTTLFRFDLVYYSLFKCNLRRIQDYPQLSGYLRDIYQISSIATTCDLEAVKRDYYGNLFPLNPGGLIPLGPALDLWQPHSRTAL
ncbi:MAG: glutathione S-transferase family protein [Pegethrix bostrychoides GSE-TBD4-15B]|jgi:putative glutathione S-transferase|uniref:Glutathione S-transferase family protein n=1 Tax=Pegethrix bostrychoides GSE-TBD4-15B TaxID=2839662 RepID=A0A951U643_9CYAN|nr:glutathione S-transferase family protein [Pegethrix bostrychoides GSE-TBD4-15B]